MKAYKYRIYPSKAQAIEIDNQIEFCRTTYNKLLALKKLAHKQYNANLGRKHLYSEVKGTKETHSQVMQNVADRLDKGFKNFFRRVKENAKKKVSQGSNHLAQTEALHYLKLTTLKTLATKHSFRK